MLTQMINSDLFTELSIEEQQLLSGGYDGGNSGNRDDRSDDRDDYRRCLRRCQKRHHNYK